MGYTTPHAIRDYLIAAALSISHDYVLRCQRRSVEAKKVLLRETMEIDLCARLAGFFGPSAHLAAQGAVGKNSIDLRVMGPTIRSEVKFFRPPAKAWTEIQSDWEYLLAPNNGVDEATKRAWVVFLPSAAADMFKFTNCLSVSSSHGPQYCLNDFAPFTPFAEPEMPPHGTNQRLRFKQPSRVSVISLPNGKHVRADVVGAHTHPLWAVIYTRTDANAIASIPGVSTIVVNDTPLVVP